jgi:predicted dienelactone hydrolase
LPSSEGENVILREFFDERRQRSIPVAEYPPSAGKPLGLLLFSVGFGGGREGYGFLARHWSSLGFLTVVVEHVGSNQAVLKTLKPKNHEDLAQMVADKVREPAELLARPYDLIYVAHQYDANLALGLAGHSFGAYTVCAASGATMILPSAMKGSKARVNHALKPRGIIAMSLQPPGFFLDGPGMAVLDMPTFLLTGTRDSGMPAGTSYRQRTLAYNFLPEATRQLAVLEGAEHMSFAGIGLKVKPFVGELESLTARFWRQVWGLPAVAFQSAIKTHWNEEAL